MAKESKKKGTPSLVKQKKEEAPIPELWDSFTDEYAEALDVLLNLYVHNKQLIAQCTQIIDGDQKGPVPVVGLKEKILTMMDEAEVPVFQHQGLKWKKRSGSRSTISREALILAGVPVEQVDKATKVSQFWVLEMDVLDEGASRR